MNAPPATTYDELPYDSQPRFGTHPDCLATLATLAGLAPAPVARCRVLELGCSNGGNLLPLASALPDSRFVGIDLSPRQIEAGRAVAAAVGLDNVELLALSILDVGDDFGEFDYILCHGVYSWVAPEVREKILAVCQRHLVPQGVAYVSYNTLPGWHQRAALRDMLDFHARQFAGPREWAGQARAFLEFLARSVPEGPYAQFLRDEAQSLRGQSDSYVFHEYLEEVNAPLYFHQFMERASAKGLQFLGEAYQFTRLANFPPEVQKTLRGLTGDPLRLEQYFDFLRNRTFRSTLLVRAGLALQHPPDPEAVSRLLAAGLARPVSERPDLRPGAAEEFRTPAGLSFSTAEPAAKALLVSLSEAMPRPQTFEALCAAVRSRLGQPAASPEPDAQVRRFVLEALLHYYYSFAVVFHTHFPPFAAQVSERPVADRLARYQAANGLPVVTRRHSVAKLPAMDLYLLPHLDGTNDRPALLEILGKGLRRGAVQLVGEGGRPVGPPEALEQALRRIARSVLLVG